MKLTYENVEKALRDVLTPWPTHQTNDEAPIKYDSVELCLVAGVGPDDWTLKTFDPDDIDDHVENEREGGYTEYYIVYEFLLDKDLLGNDLYSEEIKDTVTYLLNDAHGIECRSMDSDNVLQAALSFMYCNLNTANADMGTSYTTDQINFARKYLNENNITGEKN